MGQLRPRHWPAGLLAGTLVWAAQAGCGPSAVGPVQAQAATAPEYKVKAGFLYNLAKLTEWPTNTFGAADAPLVVAVLGQDPFGPFLEEAVAGKSIGHHPIQVRRFGRVEEVAGCQLLFISKSEREQLPRVFPRLAGHSVLTVGEGGAFARSGGMVAMVWRDGMVKLQVNPAAVARGPLKLSSRLLQLAEIVSGPAAGEGG